MPDAIISMQLTGLDEVLSLLSGLENSSELMLEALEAAADTIVELAQLYVDEPAGPVIDSGRNTGEMEESIQIASLNSTGDGGEAVVTAGGEGEEPGLAFWLEYGTGVFSEGGSPIVPSVLSGSGSMRVSRSDVRRAQMSAFGYSVEPMLHWVWSWGERAMAREVQGQPGRRYMHRVVEENSQQVMDSFVSAMLAALKS